VAAVVPGVSDAGGERRVAAAIVAGGRARRLGGAIKPLLLVDGRRILDRQLDALGPLFPALVIVVADAESRDQFRALALAGRPGIDVICDRPGPGLGPLAGIDAALGWLPAGFDAVVCVGGDMPHLAPALLAHLRDADPAAAAVVPRWSGGAEQKIEPLCARYGRALGPHISAALSGGMRALHHFVEQTATANEVAFIEEPALRALDPDLRSFANVNTPDDLARFRPA
jgi:molybdenum cofactor guanylyltransferase